MNKLTPVVLIASLATCATPSEDTDQPADTATPTTATPDTTPDVTTPDTTDTTLLETATTTTTAPPTTAPATTAAAVSADDIAIANTPPGGYGEVMPEPILADCTEPLAENAIDLRGTWQIVGPADDAADDSDVGAVVPVGAVQRIEQCGNRMVITSGGVVHDMRVDGTVENGVNDVAERDFTTPVRVAAFWEDGVHILRPDGVDIEVTRQLDGDQLIWQYFNFSARLDRVGPPENTILAIGDAST